MWLKITEAVYRVIINRMHEMCLQGAFQKVHYSKSGGYESFSMIEHSLVYSTMAKFVDEKIKEEGLDEKLGVYTRKHSAKFIEQLKEIVNKITEEDINDFPLRFKTMWD